MPFFLNIMQKHMLYVQSKTTGGRISSPGTGGIPSPTYKTFIHSYVYGIFQKTPLRSARLTQHYNYWISPITMNLNVF
jgi:hypothetical protein